MTEYLLEANARNWIVNQESHNAHIPYYALWKEEDIERETVEVRMSWWKDIDHKFQHNTEICELAKQYMQIFEAKNKQTANVTSVTKDAYTSETGINVTCGCVAYLKESFSA